MFDDKIDKIGDVKSKEAAGAQYASQLGAAQPSGIQGQEPPKEIDDKIEVSKADKTDEASGASNLQALRGSLNGNDQGFNNQGVQAGFAINSNNGVESGLKTGMQPGGVWTNKDGF